MYLLFTVDGAGHNTFDAGKYITRAIESRWALKILIFCAQIALASLVAISGSKTNSIFRAHPLPMALEMDLPASKSMRHSPSKQQVH
jgi:hypothetical protein